MRLSIQIFTLCWPTAPLEINWCRKMNKTQKLLA
jgi:hypothetical protein